MNEAANILIVASGVAMFLWLAYRNRLAMVEWAVIELLALRDAAMARRSSRVYWREQLRDSHGSKVIEWRARQ